MKTFRRKQIIKLLITSLVLILGIFSCSDGPTDPPGDTTPPQVNTVTPLNNAINVPIGTSITVNFSEKINSASVTTASFSLSNSVIGTVNVTDTVAVFSPNSDLAYNQSYTVTLTTEITDLAGNHLAAEYTFSFTTEQDPITLPPSVLSISPGNNATLTEPQQSIQIIFSKGMDTTTLNSSNILINNGMTGQFSYDSGTKTVTFAPDTFYIFDTTYTLTVTTGVQDTLGMNLTANYTSSFHTLSGTPQIDIFLPLDSSIISDFTDVSITGTHPIKLDSINYYFNGSFIGQDTASNFTFSLDASGSAIASVNSLYAIGFSATADTGYSDTLTLFYEWMEQKTDDPDGSVYQNLLKLLTRSTDSTLDIRYEFLFNTPYNLYTDTAVNIVTFLDTDLNPFTGRDSIGPGLLNGIGADYRILYGLYLREDTALARYNVNFDPPWEPIHDSGGFNFVNYYADSNFLEISVYWDSIGSPTDVYLLTINNISESQSGEVLFYDWLPDNSDGYIYVSKSHKYLGAPKIKSSKPINPKNAQSTKRFSTYTNPFN